LDGSFSAVLDVWLTYIRPWRYWNGYDQSRQLNMEPFRVFITTNGFFYVDLLYRCLERLSRVDFASNGNLIFAQHLCAVFSSPAMQWALDLLRAESDGVDWRQQFSSLLSPLNAAIAALNMEMKQLEAIEKQMNRTWWHKLLFNSESINRLREVFDRRRRVEETSKQLCQSFTLQSPSLSNESTKLHVHSPLSSLNRPIPDHAIDPHTRLMYLTPNGCKQVLNRSHEFDFDQAMTRVVPPVLAPISSNEFPMLARFSYKASEMMNAWPIVRPLIEAYDQPGLIGAVSRRILDAPCPPSIHSINEKISLSPVFSRTIPLHSPVFSRTIPLHGPSINLRIIASCSFILSLILIVLVVFLPLSISFPSSILLLLTMIVMR